MRIAKKLLVCTLSGMLAVAAVNSSGASGVFTNQTVSAAKVGLKKAYKAKIAAKIAAKVGLKKAYEAKIAAKIAAKVGLKKAYKAKIAELKKDSKYKDGISSVQFKCGKGKKILVVTPSSSIYGDGETIEVAVYQYKDGEVKYIDSIQSSGTAYPIMFTDEALLYGGNHGNGKLVIKNGKGTLYQMSAVNIEGQKPLLEVYDVVDGNRTKKSSKNLSTEEADALDYYINADDPEVIGFE